MVRANLLRDRPRKASGHAFKFVTRELAVTALNTAVRATKGQAQQAALQRHQNGERAHGIGINSRMEAQATLEGTKCGIVLHAPATE